MACMVMASAVTPVVGGEPYHKPRIRTITAFVRIVPAQQIDAALTVLRQAKAAFEKGGYEVQTIRITTQTFARNISDRHAAEALDFFKSLDQLSKEDSFIVNIGPLTLSDSSDAGKVELLSQILASTR